VVGIEDYGTAAARVRGPAWDAVRFAEWLAARDVPWSNIMLALAPHPEDRAGISKKLPRGHRPATTAAWKSITAELSVATGDALVVYWAGHGADDGSEPRLLLADTGTTGVVVEMAGLRRWLRTLGRLPEQVFFVDTCRRYDREVFTGVTPFTFPAGEPAGSMQSALYAVGYGEGAAVVPGGRTSMFSSALQAELGAMPAGMWPPDVEYLGARLKRRGDIPVPVVMVELTRRGDQRQYAIGGPPNTTDPIPRGGGTAGGGGRPRDRAHQKGRHADGPGNGGPAVQSPRKIVTDLLIQVPTMDPQRNIDELAILLKKKFKYGFRIADSPTIPQLVYELDDMVEGWRMLREVCADRNYDLFPHGSRPVRDLIAALDELIASSEGDQP
jgi:hypothetical protein